MRLNMHNWDLEAAGNEKKLADLVCDRTLKLSNRDLEGDPSETSAVGITGVCTRRNMVLARELESALHGERIPRMPAARHAGRGNVPHQFGIAAIGETRRKFSEISVEIDHQRSHAGLQASASRGRNITGSESAIITQMPRAEHAPVGVTTRGPRGSSPTQILFHHAAEAAPPAADRRQLRWRSSGSHQWSAGQQKG